LVVSRYASLFLAGTLAGFLSAQTRAESGIADLSSLSQHESPEVLAADADGYDALNVPQMRAGQSFADPVTGVRTVKLTDSATPSGPEGSSWVTLYSTMGLQVSQAWGAEGSNYTIIFHSPEGDAHLLDYRLCGSVSNYRPAPAGEGQTAFARTPGNEQVLYVANGSQLRRYDTSVDEYADTQLFPYDWNTANNAAAWLTLNKNETWATAVQDLDTGTATALNLDTAAVQERTFAGLNELAIGSGSAAWVIAEPQMLWNLAEDSVEAVNTPSGGSPLSHTATHDGFIHYFDVDQGGGAWPAYRISENNERHALPPIQGYWSDSHSSGHWWSVAEGTQPHALQSHSGAPTEHDTKSWKFGLFLVNTETSAKRLLGHHYSIKPSGIPGAASAYYDESHASISDDGKIVIFASNMNQRERRDVFLMEVPRTDSACESPDDP